MFDRKLYMKKYNRENRVRKLLYYYQNRESILEENKRNNAYKVWLAMKYRCLNPKCSLYNYYGGRGIKVCQRWMKYENFLEDMGKRPSINHSLDRIDNDGNYESSNCRWATAKMQANNRHHCNQYTGSYLKGNE